MVRTSAVTSTLLTLCREAYHEGPLRVWLANNKEYNQHSGWGSRFNALASSVRDVHANDTVTIKDTAGHGGNLTIAVLLDQDVWIQKAEERKERIKRDLLVLQKSQALKKVQELEALHIDPTLLDPILSALSEVK